MKTFEQFYRRRFNDAEPDYSHSRMPETPSYSIPSSLHSKLHLCELDVASGAIIDGVGAIDPATAATMIRFYPSYVGEE